MVCFAWGSPLIGQTASEAPAAPAPASSPASTPAAPASKAAAENEKPDSAGYAENTALKSANSKLAYSSVHVSEPYVALTFDDGPHASLTPKLLDMLKARHIRATFFVVGENAAQYPDILKRAVAEGHEIGNHSWSHPNFAKMSESAVRSQVERTQEAVTRATGIAPTILRPPYGSITDRERHLLHDSMGFKVILWDVDPLDWKDRNSATVARRILAETRPGSIVLAHDIHATTVAAMPNVIDSLIAKGYKFATVSELIAMDQPVAAHPAEKTSAPGAAPKKAKKSK